eukprot:2199554-Rhodomonas_salina.2
MPLHRHNVYTRNSSFKSLVSQIRSAHWLWQPPRAWPTRTSPDVLLSIIAAALALTLAKRHWH